MPCPVRDRRTERHGPTLAEMALRSLIIARSEVRSLPGPPVIATILADRTPSESQNGAQMAPNGQSPARQLQSSLGGRVRAELIELAHG